jgi:alkylation response protein AidB-like acyl-CoA dehydrogenase
MDLTFDRQDEDFRREARAWLEENLAGSYSHLRGRGGPGDEGYDIESRKAWEQALSRGGWTCLGWPREHGGREATLAQEVIFCEEYARAEGPGRLGHMGEHLLGPTLIAFGNEDQKAAFLPAIARGESYWCQGYSEPNAGSDLAAVQTFAEADDDHWVITGQKTWTSLAHIADWCFVLCRTDRDAPKHRGLSYLLVPMNQDSIDVRPIRQITGTHEFNEVFFDGARTPLSHIVGAPGDGWKVAMATLAFERGVSTLGQQLGFENEFEEVVALAKENGRSKDPIIRHRIARAWMELKIMRLNALRTLTNDQEGTLGREAMITKLYWATWHRDLGELAMDVAGLQGQRIIGPARELSRLQRLFLFSRADTIYAGSNEIQRNIIAERALGLPRESRSQGTPQKESR